MAVDNEGITVVQDSYTSEDVPETQSGDQEPQAEVSSMERIQSATSATAEEAIPRVEETDAGPEPSPASTAAQLDSQKSSAIEETPLQADTSTANNAVSTQVPPLSQIPDISDVSVACAAIDSASEMVESMEDSITSIVPETQIPIVQESDTTTGDASATGFVPETQAPAHTVEKQEADRQERAGSTDSELSELSEIEETQIIDDNTSAETGDLVQEEIFRAPSPALERVPGQIGIDNVIFANAAGPSKELERLRVPGPKAMLPASLPSPVSSTTSSKAECKILRFESLSLLLIMIYNSFESACSEATDRRGGHTVPTLDTTIPLNSPKRG